MPHGPSGEFAVLGSALLVADAVLIHATIQRSVGAFWGYPLSIQLSSAGTAGLIGAALLAQGVDRDRLRRVVWMFVAALSWVAAAVIGDWAGSEALFGARALPQWWYAIHKDSSGASGVAFFSGQAIAGTVAGIGLVLPILFDRTRTFGHRIAQAVVLTVVAAFTWAAIFHGTWVACGFGIVSPEAPVDIPPPAHNYP
jgi:hypothetical protein